MKTSPWTTCPTCHQRVPLPPDLEHRVALADLTDRQRQYVDAILAATLAGRRITISSIIDQIYQLDPSGGPTEDTVRTQITKARRALEPLGLTISKNFGGRAVRSTFRIEELS